MKLRSLVGVICVFALPTLGWSAVVKVEGEAFTGQGGGQANTATDRPGTSGGVALVAWDNKDHWVEYKFDVPETAEYQVQLRMAAGRGWTVYRELQIDGKSPSPAFAKVAIPPSGGFGRNAGDWKGVTVPGTVKLEKGSHTLRINNLGGDNDQNGGGNLDAVVFFTSNEKAPY